jgi:uncharacterized protein with NAD-binding domain and iron-sulfur cluster
MAIPKAQIRNKLPNIDQIPPPVTDPRDVAFTVHPQYITLQTQEFSLSVRTRDGHTTIIYTTANCQFSAVVDHTADRVVQHYETFNNSTTTSPASASLPSLPIPVPIQTNGDIDSLHPNTP